MKKLGIFMLIGLLVVSLNLSGCGGGRKQTVETTTTTTTLTCSRLMKKALSRKKSIMT
jgi:hypothetical protein